MSGLARQLRWLIVIRLVVITSVVVPYLLYQLLPEGPAVELGLPAGVEEAAPAGRVPADTVEPAAEAAPEAVSQVWFFLLLGLATYLACLLYAVLLKKLPRHYEAQAYFQFAGDLLLLTALIWRFGIGPSNPFSLLYLLIIGVATLLLGRGAGFRVAIVAYVLYAGLVLGLHFGVLPPAPGAVPTTKSPFLLGYNLGIHLFAFVAIASLIYILARGLERAQHALEAEREDLAELRVVHRDVIESIQTGLLTTDLTGTVTSINRSGAAILGAAPEALTGHRISQTDVFTPERWEELRATADEAADLRRRFEIEVRRGEGTVHIGFSASPLNDAAGRRQGYIVIFQDLTRWHHLEEEVRLKDRMAAVGELAAGIAHEIGNPLAAISGSVQLLAASCEESQQERKLLDILLKESQRLDRTIKGFLRFARPRERSAEEFDVAALLAENFELLGNSPEVSPRHRLLLDLDPPSARLVADPDQVSQIFWNLARNALKAMPEGGDLRVGGHLDGDRYLLEVSDSGRGMSEEERANLFHPFQSFFDSGVGIGMAIVYRIVEEHGGRLGVTSRPGGGTRITVKLPLAGAAAAPPPAADPGAPEVADVPSGAAPGTRLA